MKPKIFLSHNKNDKDFIKLLADELRPARIDVWYDDWEIPPGASLRGKIFEEGIPKCDLFFVYLTENSIDSKWVRQELDAAFVTELEGKGGFLALYVNNDEIRDQLPLDLRSRRIPAINEKNFSKSILELVALAWETSSRKQIDRVRNEYRIEKLELEKKFLEKELEFEKLLSESKEGNSTVTETYLKLRDRFLTIYKNLPEKFQHKDYTPKEDSEEWQSIETYWYHVFDEWYLTLKMGNKNLKQLWDSLYKNSIRSSMNKASLRLVLDKMVESEKSFGGYRDEFYEQLVSLGSKNSSK